MKKCRTQEVQMYLFFWFFRRLLQKIKWNQDALLCEKAILPSIIQYVSILWKNIVIGEKWKPLRKQKHSTKHKNNYIYKTTNLGIKKVLSL